MAGRPTKKGAEAKLGSRGRGGTLDVVTPRIVLGVRFHQEYGIGCSEHGASLVYGGKMASVWDEAEVRKKGGGMRAAVRGGRAGGGGSPVMGTVGSPPFRPFPGQGPG